jgi:hypothetical protein
LVLNFEQIRNVVIGHESKLDRDRAEESAIVCLCMQNDPNLLHRQDPSKKRDFANSLSGTD